MCVYCVPCPMSESLLSQNQPQCYQGREREREKKERERASAKKLKWAKVGVFDLIAQKATRQPKAVRQLRRPRPLCRGKEGSRGQREASFWHSGLDFEARRKGQQQEERESECSRSNDLSRFGSFEIKNAVVLVTVFPLICLIYWNFFWQTSTLETASLLQRLFSQTKISRARNWSSLSNQFFCLRCLGHWKKQNCRSPDFSPRKLFWRSRPWPWARHSFAKRRRHRRTSFIVLTTATSYRRWFESFFFPTMEFWKVILSELDQKLKICPKVFFLKS